MKYVWISERCVAREQGRRDTYASRMASGVVEGNGICHVESAEAAEENGTGISRSRDDIGSRNDMTAMRCCEDIGDYGACIGRVAVRAGTGAERTLAEAGCR